MYYMNCIVKNCRNRAYPGTTIRFHQLPKDERLRDKWLSKLPVKTPKKARDVSWVECAVVCGDHFQPEQYDECNRLFDNAVPIKKEIDGWHRKRVWYSGEETSSGQIQSITIKHTTNEQNIETSTNYKADSSTENNEASENEEEIETIVEIVDDDSDIPEAIKVTSKEPVASVDLTDNEDDLNVPEVVKACRVCLATDGRMFRLQDRKHQLMYTEATGFAMAPDDAFPQYLCWECVGRVLSAVKFRVKARAANDALMGILYDHGRITMDSLQSVNRREHKLKSQLSKKYIKPNEYISLREVQLKNISDITHDIQIKEKNLNENKDLDMGYDNLNYRELGLFNDDEFIQDRTLIDITDENDTDILMDGEKNYTNILVVVEKHDTDVLMDGEKNDTNIVNVVEKNETNILMDEDLNENGPFSDVNYEDNEKVDEIDGDESTKGLWVGKVTENVDWNHTFSPRQEGKDVLEGFKIIPLSKEQEIEAWRARKDVHSAYQCGVCYRVCPTHAVYEKHVIKHTEKYGTFACEICKLRKQDRRAVARHVRRCHGRGYKCNKCPFFTVELMAAKIHHRKHNAGVGIKCSICSKKFTKASYSGHMRSVHPCAVPCEHCGLTFLTSLGKRTHQRKVHLEDLGKPLSGPHCATCDVTFATQKAHDTHLTKSSRHNANRSSIITNNFVRKKKGSSSVNTPVFTSVTCEQCDQMCSSIRLYKDHFKTNHPGLARAQHVPDKPEPRFICEYCGKTYTGKPALEDHMTVHSGVQFECYHCGKKFAKRTLLILHMNIHSETRRTYECKECGKRFFSSSGRRRHIKSRHAKLKPYKCEACGKSFILPYILRQHIDHMHNHVPRPKRYRRRTDH